MARDFILEIGMEEMPARVIPSALAQMEELASKLLQEERLSYKNLVAYATPRRLTLHITELAEEQEELVKEVKGPPVRTAFTPEGQPTRAALGFAQSQGVAVEELVIRSLPGGDYVFAVKKETGRPALEALPGILTKLVEGLNFPRPMRWGDMEWRFIRPVRWLLALYGSEVVPWEWAGLKADRFTYGHRFLSPGPHSIPSSRDYFQILEKAYVIVDHRRRRQLIWQQVQSLALKANGRVEEDPELLEEITFLVEYPTALIGRIEEKYLSLPEEVVTTPMRGHQRYFPVRNGQGKLLPLFIAVHNGTETYIDNIRPGYEKVLKARLTDAAFFYQEDRKTTLASKVPRLKEILFQENLGTMWDKTRRIKHLSLYLARVLDLPDKIYPYIERTAELAKADLVTSMVYEFPELQGIMGYYYAAEDGEEREVCEGIRQHYWPRFSGDRVPEALTGMVVGLADRLDTLVGCFACGLIPTGSQDPYGLRRQALGMVTIAVELGLKFSLSEAISAAYRNYINEGIALPRPLEEVEKELMEFFRGRIEYILSEKGVRYDVVDAVLAVGWDDLADTYARACDLEVFRQEGDFAGLHTAFTRAFNLSRQVSEEIKIINEERLTEEAEQRLYLSLQETKKKVEPYLARGDYLKALHILTSLREPIDNFFDKVLVMAPDPEVRRNRIALLQGVTSLVLKIADFSRLVSVQ